MEIVRFYRVDQTKRMRTELHNQLEFKSCRNSLEIDENKRLASLRSGYEGELQFDSIVLDEAPEILHLKDFRFMVENQEYQIDNILISGDTLFLFEIKNFTFDLNFSSEIWTFMNGKEWINPIIQVDNQRNKFNKLLSPMNYQLPVHSNVVFINPDQTIYNLYEHPKIHIYSNIKKRLRSINKENRIDHSELLNYLTLNRVTQSKYYQSIDVDLDKVKKGIVCNECFEFLVTLHRKKYLCAKCNKSFTSKQAAIELIQEMKIMNKNLKRSSYWMAELCGRQISSSLFRNKDVIEIWNK